MAEQYNHDSAIKGQLSEQALKNVLKSRGLNFRQNASTGVNHPNVDFEIYLTPSVLMEMKDWFNSLDLMNVKGRCIPKFKNTIKERGLSWDSVMKIIVCSRMTEPSKEYCRKLGILVWEYGKQLVSKKQYNSYSLKKQKHATPNLVYFIHIINHSIDQLLGLKKGSKGSHSVLFWKMFDLCELEQGGEPERADVLLKKLHTAFFGADLGLDSSLARCLVTGFRKGKYSELGLKIMESGVRKLVRLQNEELFISDEEMALIAGLEPFSFGWLSNRHGIPDIFDLTNDGKIVCVKRQNHWAR